MVGHTRQTSRTNNTNTAAATQSWGKVGCYTNIETGDTLTQEPVVRRVKVETMNTSCL